MKKLVATKDARNTEMSPLKKTAARLSTWMLLSSILAAGPILATDPQEVDPDPDTRATAATTYLFLDRLEQVDFAELTPGLYSIYVHETREIYEIVVPD